MGEHSFDFQMLQGEDPADRIEVVKAYTVAVHPRVDRKVSLAVQIVFFEVLVEGDGGLQVGKSRGQLKFDKVREVSRNARSENQNRKVHAVLAKEHTFGKMGDTQKIRSAVLCRISAGEGAVAVAVRFHGKENFRLLRNGLSDKLNVARESVQVDFDPIRARDTVQIRRKLCQIHSIQNID